ncbi:MAG: outer membrane beta-barrel protein [Rhodobacteraceae bacterium]|nr:outer membrane beta-barrel protein [Paracoccaceae bacterium]
MHDVRINLHDRFSFFQDPLQQGSVGGTNNINSRYGQAENVAGISLEWDLNKLLLSAGFDYAISFATSDEFSYLDRNAQFYNLRAGFLVAPELTVGLETTAGATQYDNSNSPSNGSPQLDDSTQFSVGPFIDWQMSRFMRLELRGGYTSSSFDSTNSVDSSNYYVYLSLDHDLNRYMRYTLGLGHYVTLGINSDALNLSFVRLAARWQILRKTDITTDLFYEHGEELGATSPETYDRFGFSIGLGYNLTQHLFATLRYSFTDKSSDQPQRGYQQNQVGINLRYQF